LFDGFGSFDPDIIYNRIEYLAQDLIQKSSSLITSQSFCRGLDGDERRMIDTTMTRLRSLVERTGIALFLVSHLKRTSSDQNHEEGSTSYTWTTCVEVQQLHNYLTQLLDLNATNRADLNSLYNC
jgi:hypothetical protein